jgi:hypothetical protein
MHSTLGAGGDSAAAAGQGLSRASAASASARDGNGTAQSIRRVLSSSARCTPDELMEIDDYDRLVPIRGSGGAAGGVTSSASAAGGSRGSAAASTVAADCTLVFTDGGSIAVQFSVRGEYLHERIGAACTA